jgi:transposase-like protein
MEEREQQRKIKHRLAVIRHAQEVTGNVAQTCRCYGSSRQCFDKWLRRHEELGEEGLRDKSSAALTSPKATEAEVVSKSSSSACTPTSVRRRSRCLWLATTTSPSAPQGSGGS